MSRASRLNRRSLFAVIGLGVIQALAFGIYETSLPLFFEHMGISLLAMGFIFGFSQVGILAVRYVVGSLSDRYGRKPFMVAAAGVLTAATALIPLSPLAAVQALLKVLRDAAAVSSDIIRSVVIYEHARSRFLRWIGRSIGAEFFFMAVGATLAGMVIARLGYLWPFMMVCTLYLLSFLVVSKAFVESPRRRPAPPPGLAGPQGKWGFDLPANLIILVLVSFTFNVGLMMSHSFYLLLFFKRKFAFSVEALGVIQGLHRFSLGIPTILAAQYMDKPKMARHYKKLYILTMAAQGAFISLAGLIPHALLACGTFLLHDLLGATVFTTIHAAFVQRYARPYRRARDVALCSGLSALGYVFGPPLAGWLVDGVGWRDGPFIMSGVIIICASLIVFRLREDAPLAKGAPERVA